MKRIAFLASAALLVLVLSASAFAMTGSLVNGEPPYNEVNFTTFDTSSNLHDETVDNPYDWYKGWWYVNLTNNTGQAWSSVTINPGAGDLVAIVQGDNLQDEWGFVGSSVVANKPGAFAYSNYIGSRTYTDFVPNTTGQLWGQAVFTFATPLAVGQKIGFKIYTDNSYYEGPYASSFCMCLTPTAVPEPSSLLALFGGVTALAGLARRKR